MNTAIVLAGGTGVRMRNNGMPKQFLELYGKPIIIYTLEIFENCSEIDRIVIPCNENWIEHMLLLVKQYHITKVTDVIVGGKDRQASIQCGLSVLSSTVSSEDVVLIHDGVRPLVSTETIIKNILVTKKSGNAMTVKANTETVVISESDTARYCDFKNRKNCYTLTSPQSFRVEELMHAYEKYSETSESVDTPLLDASLIYAKLGIDVFLVKEDNLNIKITTPEDFYYLKAYLELQESRYILGL